MENIYSNNKKKKTLDFTFLLKSYQKMKRKEKKRKGTIEIIVAR